MARSLLIATLAAAAVLVVATGSTDDAFVRVAHAANSRKVFIENDGMDTLIPLLPLLAGMDIVGLSMSFGNTEVVDALGQATDALKDYNLSSCIPVYAGASKPLKWTKNSFDNWVSMYGRFAWAGAYENSYENSYNWSQVTYDSSKSAAQALVDLVKQYPGEIEIYEAGLFTTVAQAMDIYPDIVNQVKTIWVMSGYIDNSYIRLTGNSDEYDINTDFNFILDPEAASQVLSGGFKEIYLAGNTTNSMFTPQWMFDDFIDAYAGGSLTQLQANSSLAGPAAFIGSGNVSQPLPGESGVLPLWDDGIAAIMAWPETITNVIANVTVGIDVSYNSPFYGLLRVWPKSFAPLNGTTGVVKFIAAADNEALYKKMYEAMAKDWSSYCATGASEAL